MRLMELHPTPLPARRSLLSRLLLASLWLAAVAAMAASFLPDLNATRLVAALASLLFIVTLIGHLVRVGPHAIDLPDLAPLVAPRLRLWGMTTAIALSILVVLVIGLLISPGLSLLAVAFLVALGMVIRRRGKLSRPVVLVGLTAGLMVGLGIRYLEHGQLAWALMNAVAVPVVFVAGVLLVGRSGLGQVRLVVGQYRLSLRGFLSGCVLATPAAILNLMGNAQGGDTWVRHWWQPLAALDAAIAEEVWARLFLMTLVYVLLRPLSGSRPNRALGVAVLLSALTHAFAHTGINPIGLFIGGLLYGIPPGLPFVKRDLEHAIGYHFGIDYIRYLAALATLGEMPLPL